MRDQALDMLPDIGTILTKTQTSDGQGGFTTTWLGTASTDCRVDVKSGREQTEGGGWQSYQKTILTLPYNAVINTENRFTYGSNEYNVVWVSGTDRSWNVTVRCELEKV